MPKEFSSKQIERFKEAGREWMRDNLYNNEAEPAIDVAYDIAKCMTNPQNAENVADYVYAGMKEIKK